LSETLSLKIKHYWIH